MSDQATLLELLDVKLGCVPQKLLHMNFWQQQDISIQYTVIKICNARSDRQVEFEARAVDTVILLVSPNQPAIAIGYFIRTFCESV